MDQDFLKEVSAQLRKPSGEFGNEIAQRMNESNLRMNLDTINSLKIEDDHTVLEIGMGNGFFIKEILSKANKVKYIGCDYSEDMVALSTEMNQTFIDSGQATFHLSEAHHLPTDNSSIDHLFTINTIYFWNDIPTLLSEFKRVLKPNGTLAISLRPEGCLRQFPSTQYNFTYYNAEQVSEILKAHGFSVKQIIEVTEPEMEVMKKHLIPEFAILLAHKTSTN
tara:strand:+ start:48645 stop:49310 length:666 start_codon:yes stop_codon:yes gene_type:complete